MCLISGQVGSTNINKQVFAVMIVIDLVYYQSYKLLLEDKMFLKNTSCMQKMEPEQVLSPSTCLSAPPQTTKIVEMQLH